MYDCIDRWADYLGKEKGLSPNSIEVYRRHLDQLTAFAGDDPRMLDTETIRRWLHSAGGSVSTFGSRISGLNSFYKWMVTTKQRMDNPMTGIESPKRNKGLPRPVENLEAAFVTLDELDRRNNRNAAKMRCLKQRPVGESRMMMVFLCETGLRISEAVSLNVPTPAPPQIRIIGKGSKHAIVPLTDKAREALDFLGGRWPLNARGTQRRFAEAGFSPHQCRHWRGTSMAAAGVDLGDIRAMLRHESMDTTLGYSAWTTERVRDALSKVS
jgi:site-specific recombinase XerD